MLTLGVVQRTAMALIGLWLVDADSLAPHRPSLEATVPLRVPAQIEGRLVIPRGAVARLETPAVVSAGASLVLEAGARLLATSTDAAIVVERGGRLDVQGTLLEPVILGCERAVLGCWEGVVINGAAPIVPEADAVVSPGASCPELVIAGAESTAGGCDADDDSGALRFARIQYARRGLELNGVGRGTVVDYVQVHGSEGPGALVRGGTADVRHLVLTEFAEVGLRWRDGWSGRAQFLLVQGAANARAALEGSGRAALGAPSPELWNATLSALTPRAGESAILAGVRLTASDVRIGNVLMVGLPYALDLDAPGGCASNVGADLFATGIVQVAALADPDSDDGCPANAEASWLQEPLRDTRVVPDSVIAVQGGLAPTLIDLRPSGAATTLANGATPPMDGFFDPTARYVGSAPPAAPVTAIPFHSGWTIDGEVLPPPPAFALGGSVTSPELGPLPGVTITAAGAVVATSDATGAYTTTPLELPAVLVAAGLPPNCSATASATVTSPGDPIAFSVTCLPPPPPSAGDVRLTYICGNTFRVRNNTFGTPTVVWSVAGTTETGSLVLPIRPANASFSETFFASVATGTVVLRRPDGGQLDVKANGGFVCAPLSP